jgi:hypothetical protein
LDAICVKHKWEAHFELQISAFRAQCKIAMARSLGDKYLSVLRLVRDFEDKAGYVDVNRIGMTLCVTRSRVSLLDPDGGDPGRPWHSARTSARSRLKSPLDIHDRYSHALLVLDIRIAALRFAIGLSPVDDEYFDGAVSTKAPGARCQASDILSRQEKAKAACRIALRHAKHIDTMLGCDWREKDVRRRERFIENL